MNIVLESVKNEGIKFQIRSLCKILKDVKEKQGAEFYNLFKTYFLKTLDENTKIIKILYKIQLKLIKCLRN